MPFFCFPTFYDTKWTETALSLCDVDKDYFLTFLTRELPLIEINSLCSCIMATRKSIRQSNTRKRPYERPVNDSDPDFWPKEKLIIKLKDIGIEVPSNLSKNVLKQLFMQNNKNNRTETHVNMPTADNGQNMLVENVNDLSTPRPAISSENSNDTMSNVLNTVASLAKSYLWIARYR